MSEPSEPQSSRRQLFPLNLFERRPRQRFAEDGRAIPNRCIYKCGAACYHQAPNEQRADDAFEAVARRRFGRRSLLKGAAASAPLVLSATPVGSALLGDASPLSPKRASAQVPGRSLGFAPITLNTNDAVTVPTGYQAQVVLRWGDPLFPDTERLTMANASKALQERTFGYNCDMNHYFPLDGGRRGILAVNHEYTEGARMFANYSADNPTKGQVDTEIAAHGLTIVELQRSGATWSPVLSSRFNRRITGETPIEISGPLRGNARLQTSEDPTGTMVRGTLNNCAGGRTLWGTVVTAEENWNQYFGNGAAVADADQKGMNGRYGLPEEESERKWERFYSRFDLAAEPNEVNRFGYIVEIDPMNPNAVPKKRTALGRLKHEAFSMGLTRDGRVAGYTGDDERFEYLYKFVTRGTFDSNNPQANSDLLDEGTLYAARFNDDGTGEWLPLVAGRGALADWSVADILIDTRGAGDAVGATPMDRPEDVEVNPWNQRVYMALTNNTNRTAAQLDGANPRAENANGHVIEISEFGGDLGATRFQWEIFLLCGNPEDPTTYFAGFDKSRVSALAAPDNVTFDPIGNLWIATDGQVRPIGRNDTIYAVPVAGPERGRVQPFLSVPKGAEVCGPEFTPDGTTLFANVQHPGENSEGPNAPESVWPDGAWPPLPSLVAVTRSGGGRIGT